MATSSGTVRLASPVTVSLSDLEAGTVPHSTLAAAFGPSSLGILVVSGLPASYPALRSRVLSSSSQLASLPASTLTHLTNPTAKYLTGWSHGVETLRPGVVDTLKGSYYINCAFYQDPSLQAARDAAEKFPGFEEYTAPNRWPSKNDLPGFRQDAEELIKLIIDTAVLVARACDRFAASEGIEHYPSGGYLEGVVRGSTTTKARLLHYFPASPAISSGTPVAAAAIAIPHVNGHDTSPNEQVSDDDWCATHVDHGCLTGLTSAMFVDESAPANVSALSNSNSKSATSLQTWSTVPPPSSLPILSELPSTSPLRSPQSGLYIRSRAGETVQVRIPRDCLAFQTGQALELITRGRFKAVPHFVRGGGGSGVARNTLAVFTQPNLDELVDLQQSITFGEFARGVVKRNTTTITSTTTTTSTPATTTSTVQS